MSYRMRGLHRTRAWRVPILHQALGLGTNQHVDVLKDHLAEAQLTPLGAKLDLVILEDLEHFEELMSDGIPMARVDDAPEPPDERYVRVTRRRWNVLLAGAFAGILFMPSVWMWPTRARQERRGQSRTSGARPRVVLPPSSRSRWR